MSTLSKSEYRHSVEMTTRHGANSQKNDRICSFCDKIMMARVLLYIYAKGENLKNNQNVIMIAFYIMKLM